MVNNMTEMFYNLKNRLSQISFGLGLDNELDIDKIDSYQELTKAYLLLVHAELEKYFEMLSLAVAKSAYDDYDKAGKVSIPLLAVSSINLYALETHPDDYNDLKTDEKKKVMVMHKRISQIYGKYLERVKGNNGIKNKDIFKLFWSIGISKDEIGEDLLMQLDSLGEKRGFIAHTGNSIRLLNYEEEKSKINYLMQELEKFDAFIVENNYINSNLAANVIEGLLYSRT